LPDFDCIESNADCLLRRINSASESRAGACQRSIFAAPILISGEHMKKILLATSALLATVCVASAADLAARHYAKAPVAPIATVYD
jgi:hypothetical protein